MITDAAAGQSVRLGATENAKHIILGAGEAGGFEKLLGILAEGVCGFEEGDEGAGFEGGGLGARDHDERIVVTTNIVKRKYYEAWPQFTAEAA
jgi:hypothetical protein